MDFRTLKHGESRVELDLTDTMYPSRSRLDHLAVDGRGVAGGAVEHATFYAFVLRGRVRFAMALAGEHDVFELTEGAYLSSTGAVTMRALGEDSLVYTIERLGYRGQRQSGRIEKRGRLSYIDGCSDSLLVYPPRLGDPCLNHLHFPKGIVQTQHLHPSIRLGIVVRGAGKAWGPGWEHPLEVGSMFVLHEQEIHSFATPGESMDVIAFHPDSDTGPTDVDHPMINRTLIDHGKTVR